MFFSFSQAVMCSMCHMQSHMAHTHVVNWKAPIVYKCSHSGKAISIFALLLNLWTPGCLMCSELQHRCHSLSYAGRHFSGSSWNITNTMCTTSKMNVCKAHEGECFPTASLHFRCPMLAMGPSNLLYQVTVFIKYTRCFTILGQPEIWSCSLKF